MVCASILESRFEGQVISNQQGWAAVFSKANGSVQPLLNHFLGEQQKEGSRHV
jgi:hypothetical protein